jgi:predicted dehydrogenase
VSVIVDQPRRGDARYLAVRQVIEKKTLGGLQSAHCLLSGHLMHTGIHAWDVLLLWMDEWSAVAAWLGDTELPEQAHMSRTGESSGTQDQSGLLAESQPAESFEAIEAMGDRGGHAHVVFASGAHAFVSGALKNYFVFQFDLVFEGGRIRLGNDVDEVWTPGPSPRYSGFRELRSAGQVVAGEPPRPMLLDLIDAMEEGREPWMSLGHAAAAFTLGVAVFQSHLEGHRYVRPDEVRPSLPHEDALRNAPAQANGLFVVPKIVE